MTASAGCEPANLSTKGQHPTSKPPKPLTFGLTEGQALFFGIWPIIITFSIIIIIIIMYIIFLFFQ
jgi:hypothetical protein